jgi:hypothetical protein
MEAIRQGKHLFISIALSAALVAVSWEARIAAVCTCTEGFWFVRKTGSTQGCVPPECLVTKANAFAATSFRVATRMFARERLAAVEICFLGIRRHHYKAAFNVAIHGGGTAHGI